MLGKQTIHKEKPDFGVFGMERIVPDSKSPYRLFDVELKEKQIRQQNIFIEMEKDLVLYAGSAFSDQVHFQLAHQTPVQRWFPYREGYSINLVDNFLKEFSIKANTFDPFSGSGTTLIASRMNNIKSFGVDINPISVLIAQVENEQYTQKDSKYISDVIRNIESLEPSEMNCETSFHLADKVFNEDILKALLQLKYQIRKIGNEKIENLIFLSWLSIIEDVSNIKKEGNGIKYKNRKRTRTGYINIDKESGEHENFPSDKFQFVRNRLVEQLQIILSDIKFNYGSCENKPQVFQGDCLEFEKFFADEIQFTFFSPPYCNCFDYFEIHKVELWLGDFVNSRKDFSLLRQNGFRSNTNVLNGKPIIYMNEKLESLINLFDPAKLWNKNIPTVVGGYFDDMHTLLQKIYQQTVKNGLVGIVVGNSAYSGVIIPTDMLIAQIAKEIGFKSKGLIVTRHLTTSSQQKKELELLNGYLRESIVLLEK